MFDVIFCDVPCSGSGSWRRDPDGKWKLNEHSWQNLLNTQIEVLNEAQKLLKTDGILIYATCSVLLSENYKQLEKFCSINPEFEIKKIVSWLGFDWDDSYLYPYKSQQAFFTASNVQVRSPINNKSVGGWEKYSQIMHEPQKIFTQNNFSLDSFEKLIN